MNTGTRIHSPTRRQASKARQTAVAFISGAALLTGAIASAGTATASTGHPAPPCLWAGNAHAPGTTVSAGGWSFTCDTERPDAPRWVRGGPVDGPSTVENTGATRNPTGLFSSGAWQFGTDYTDYCVGSQLIEGREDVYTVVVDAAGMHYWKAAAPVSDWRFESDAEQPGPSWRSVSLCDAGNLL
ncbi:hypothetical protein [Nocardia callitridis]|uniref:Ig-like domain-containing protein n=1 Tax=Nocardia callitridis TaxID=648753 RepID=A0ABP9KEZ8_9NOCA